MSERLIRRAIVGLTAAILACALPSVATATDYCVGLNTSCEAQNHKGTLGDALAAAAGAPDPDRILLGAETYTAPTVAGYTYQAPTSPVEIVGAGIGKTILTGPTGAESILDLAGGPGTAASDLTVHAPANASFGFDGISTGNAVRRVEVTEDPSQSKDWRKGVYLSAGGSLEDSTVKLDVQWGTRGVFLAGGTVRRSSLSAEIAATTNSGSIERSRLVGYTGVWAYGGVTSIVASRIVGGEDYGIHVGSYANVDHSTVNADSVTIIGDGPGKGAYATTELDTGWSADINLTNSVIRGFAASLGASATGTGEARVAASYSDYDPSGNSKSSGNAFISESNVSNVGDAGFVNAAGGDYHLLPGSPLVDSGDPTTAQGLDLDASPLVADGNGDGSARRDLGAYELPAAPIAVQPAGTPADAPADTAPPVVTGFRAAPALFTVGRASTALAARLPRGTRFRYALSEQARVFLRIQRRLAGRRARYRTVGRLSRAGRAGANVTRFSGRLGRRALQRGRYRVRVVAIDAAGNRSARRTARFRIARR